MKTQSHVANIATEIITSEDGKNTYEIIKKIENYILSKKKNYNYGVLLSLYTGMRLGELLVLKWSDIDFNNGIISINKVNT